MQHNRERLELHKQYCEVFGSPAGQAVQRDLERRGFFNRSTYSLNRTDGTADMIWREGRRGLVLYIRDMQNPEYFLSAIAREVKNE